MNKFLKSNLGVSFLFLAALFFVLLIQGAIPFFTAPTLGQALWAAGFGQSFINESIFNIYARNFGAPEPAAIAFGLAGAWPVGILIKIGLHPIDAYTTMAAGWITLGFFSAYRIGRYFSLSSHVSLLGAVAWGSMPIMWVNAGYSMTSIGMTLLSFYLLTSFKLFWLKKPTTPSAIADVSKVALLYLAACLIAVFMDGYTFIMFAVGSSFIGGVMALRNKSSRDWVLTKTLPLHFLCFAIAYYAYSSYIGKSDFPAGNIDNFRSSGNDFSFFFIPTQGIHWIMDILGVSVARSEKLFFGDAPVWMSAFCAPILIGTIWATWKLRRERNYSAGLLLCMLFGFYMSLGPSLKINSKRPPNVTRSDMPAQYALAPTGSGILSKHLPGFKNMRVSHRWLALGVFGSWALVILALSDKKRGVQITGACILSGVTFLNAPNIPKKLRSDISYRNQAYSLDGDFIEELDDIVIQGETVAFLPYGNDFLLNYAASRLKIITYNIGGDKNLTEAKKHWPVSMRQLPMGWTEGDFPLRLIQVLACKDTDVVIIPYVDLLWAAHGWPAPLKLKENATRILRELKSYSILEIEENDYCAAVRLSAEWKQDNSESILKEAKAPLISIPMYSSEWHGLERNNERYWQWSRGSAQVEIYNFSHAPVDVEINFSLTSLVRRDLTILNTNNEELWSKKKLKAEEYVKLNLQLSPGPNVLNFETRKKPSHAPNDNRALAFRMNNFAISELGKIEEPE